MTPNEQTDCALLIVGHSHLRLSCLLFFSFLALLHAGCGPSQEVLDAQDRDIQEEYEKAAEMPPHLPPHLRERREKRLEMDFGIRPNESDSGSKPE